MHLSSTLWSHMYATDGCNRLDCSNNLSLFLVSGTKDDNNTCISGRTHWGILLNPFFLPANEACVTGSACRIACALVPWNAKALTPVRRSSLVCKTSAFLSRGSITFCPARLVST